MSKWKKVGSVHSGDDRSNRSVRSRSREDIPNRSFHQNIALMKINNAQMVDSENTYFCKNYLDRKRSPEGHRSHSKLRTERSITSEGDVFRNMKSTFSRKHISRQEDNLSHISSGPQKKSEAKKLKKYPQRSEIQSIREDHERLKNYVKTQISAFKGAMANLSNELRFQIFQKRAISPDSSSKGNPLKPIVPHKFNSQILDNMNFSTLSNKKQSGKQFGDNFIAQIMSEAESALAYYDQTEKEKAEILKMYPEVNLEELLS